MPTPEEPPKSYGNISADHWTRSRAGRNREAMEYMRGRSRAPGVESGGAARNFYCMECDGVVPHDHPGPGCPHCGADLSEKARRYFNWVEIDRPVESDLRVLLPWIGGGALLLVGLAALLAWLLG